ncbi:MAG: TonB family protein [Candidatus Krumholzibacteriia bacterium]
MLRSLPWSLAGHVALLAMLAAFGGSVAPPRAEPHSAIRVRIGGGPPGARGVQARQSVPGVTAAREGPASPPKPQPGTRRLPAAAKKPVQAHEKKPVGPTAKGLAPDRPSAQAAGPGQPGVAGAIGKSGGSGGTGGSGTGASAGGTDQPFPFAWYLTLVEGHISRNWNPSLLGFGAQAARGCVVHFVILENGAITEPTVEEPSGVALYDREALRAVTAANPLPPLPRGFGARSLGVSFIFTLKATP